MDTYGIGIDVGGTFCKIGLFRASGVLLKKWQIPTDISDNGMHILDDVALSVQEELRQSEISMSEVQGIGIGIPGSVNQRGVVFRCPNLGWNNVDVPLELSRRMQGMKVKAVNDANAAALGEMWQGGGKGYRNIVMLTLGTGVGGGIVFDGAIVPGVNGLGGEIGHITMKPDETECCSCGNRGCLEQYCSATGIVKLTKRKLERNQNTSLLNQIEHITARDVFDAYTQGDQLAGEVVVHFASILGKALRNLSVVLDPEIFVIGGGVSKAGKPLLDLVVKFFHEEIGQDGAKTKVGLAELGNDAGIYGSVKLILGKQGEV